MAGFRSLVPQRESSLTPARRDEILDPIVGFRRELDRMFDSFFEGFGQRSATDWPGVTPALDVQENAKELVLTAELPGVSEDDVEVTLSGELLTIKGEKRAEDKQKNGDFSYVERRYGSFARSLRLPFEVKDEDVEATYDRGVLSVRIPKPAEAQSPVRKIEVRPRAK